MGLQWVTGGRFGIARRLQVSAPAAVVESDAGVHERRMRVSFKYRPEYYRSRLHRQRHPDQAYCSYKDIVCRFSLAFVVYSSTHADWCARLGCASDRASIGPLKRLTALMVGSDYCTVQVDYTAIALAYEGKAVVHSQGFTRLRCISWFVHSASGRSAV